MPDLTTSTRTGLREDFSPSREAQSWTRTPPWRLGSAADRIAAPLLLLASLWLVPRDGAPNRNFDSLLEAQRLLAAAKTS